MVVWSILAAIPLLALLALWLLRCRYHLEYVSPASLRVVAGIHFLGWRKSITADPLRALGLAGDEDSGGAGKSGPHGEGPRPAPDANGPSGHPRPGSGDPQTGLDPAGGMAGQRGALRLPESWLALWGRTRERFRRAGLKWILDFGVWRLLAGFAWRSSRRVLWLFRPRIEFLHVGLADAYDLARLASVWSVAQATVPALACPVTYGFGAREAEARIRLGGGFTALGAVLLGLVSVTTFPLGGLLRRFAHCWRDPELSGWQKRVLLP